MRKKRNNSLSKKIIAAMLCVFIMTVSINPGFASYVYANSTAIQGVFNETLSEDKTSSVVDLRIDEAEDKTIESVTLPDQTKIVKEDFKHDNNKLLIEYTAIENKNLEFVVEYTEKQQEVITPVVRKETLSYEVKDIIVPKEPTLKIEARDITYKVAEKVDFRKDITIKDENDKDITSQLNFDIINYGEYTEGAAGSYELTYIVKHPISQKEYTFSRRVNIEKITKETISEKGVLETNAGFNLSVAGWSENAKIYNITLSTAMAKLSTGNVIRINLPQYVKLETIPSANVNVEKVDVTGSNDLPTGTNVYIHIKDSATINGVYDGGLTISVNQDDYLINKGKYNGKYEIDYLYTNNQGMNISTKQEFTFKNTITAKTEEIKYMQSFGDDVLNTTVPISFNADMSLVDFDKIGNFEIILPDGITWLGDTSYFTPSDRKLSIPITKDMVNEANGSIPNGLVKVPLSFALEFADVNSKSVYPQFKSDKLSATSGKKITFVKEKIRYTVENTGESIIKSIDEVTDKSGSMKTPKVFMLLHDEITNYSRDSLSKVATSDFDKSLINGEIKVIYEIGSDYIWNGNESIQVDGIDILYDKDAHTVEAKVPSSKLVEFQSKRKIAILANIDLPLYMDKDKLEKDLLDSGNNPSQNGVKEQTIKVKSVEMTYNNIAVLSDSTTLKKDLSYKTTIYEPVVSVSLRYARVLYFGSENSELFKLNISTPSNMSSVDSVEINSKKIPEELRITGVSLPSDMKFLKGTKLLYATNKTSSIREHVFDGNTQTFQTNGEYITSYQLVLPKISKSDKAVSVEIKFHGDISSDILSGDKVEVVMPLTMPKDSFGKFRKSYGDDYTTTNAPFKEADIMLKLEVSKGTVEARLNWDDTNKNVFKQGTAYENIFNLSLKADKNDTQIVKGINIKKDKTLADGFEINKVTLHPDLFTYANDVKFKYSTNKKSSQEFIPSSTNTLLKLDDGEFLYDYTIEIGEIITTMPYMKDAVKFGGKARNKDLSGKEFDIVYTDTTTAKMTMKITVGNVKNSMLTLNNLSLVRDDSIRADTIKTSDSLSNYYIEGGSFRARSTVNTIGTSSSIPIDLVSDINLPNKFKVTSISLQNVEEVKYKELQLVYKTNLNTEERTDLVVNNTFALPEGEYFTSASIVMKETTHNRLVKNGTFTLDLLIKNDKYDRDNELIDKVTDDVFGVTLKNYDGTNVEGTGKIRYYRDTPLNVNLKVENYKTVGDKSQFYPEDIITVTQSATLEIRNPNKNTISNQQKTIESPIYYIPLGKGFDYVENSLIVTNFMDKKPLAKVVSEGDTKYLKIEFYGDEMSYTGLKAQDKLKVDFQFDVKVSRFVNESNKALVMSSLGVSLDRTLEHMNSGETTDESYISSFSGYNKALVIKGENVFLPTNEGKQPYPVNTVILQYAGISSIHAVKTEYSEEFKDDVDFVSSDTIDYQFSVANRVGNTVKSYYAYIPVPKKGDTIEYLDENVKKTFTQEWDSLLTAFPTFTSSNNGKVNIDYSSSNQPSTAGDNDPKGEYNSKVKLEDVTMIRIKVSDMGPKFTANLKASFSLKSSKVNTGKLKNIMNVKYIYNYENSNIDETFSGQLKHQNWNLYDYEIAGFVWEDSNKDGVFIAEQKISGVELEIKESDTGDVVANLTTGADGSYHYPLSNLNKNYSIHIDMKKDWYLTEKEKGDPVSSSHFDVDTKIAEITNQNYKNINAGLISLAKVEVTPNPIQVKEGEVTAPIKIELSNMSDDEKASLNVSIEDENIAFYDNDLHVVRGIKEGETNLIASIKTAIDGKVIKEKVKITVSKDKLPSAQFDDITMFVNSKLKEKEGIVIKDGSGNEVDINDTNIIRIDASNVKVNVPGKYSITYSVELQGVKTEFNRDVYVHGNIQLIVPNDATKKVGESVPALDGASATYIHINEDGTQTVTNVPVTTPNAIITSSVVRKTGVPLEATVTVDGATDTATGGYILTFNEKAVLTTVMDNVTVKVGATLDEIKASIQAGASMMTPDGKTELTNSIDWSILNHFDASIAGNTVTGKIFVLDPDTGEKVENEITVTISQNVVINTARAVNLVVGDSFDPFANVTIKDGDGNDVTLTADMIVSNNVEIDSNNNTTKRGVYEVEYEYTDKYGNTKRAKTTVNVHGQLQFDDTRKDFLENDSVADVNSLNYNKDLAYYIDATGNKKLATLKTVSNASSSTIGKSSQNLVYMHPVNGNDITFLRAIYVHGHVIIWVPNTYTVKVNLEINTLKNVIASYKFVEDDGTIVEKTATVTSALGNKTTSAVPTVKTIPVEAHAEVVAGLNSNATKSYTIIFNGLPTITAANDSVEVRIGASFDEIKNAINALASVQYGNETNLTDLTGKIDWDEVQAIDTSIKDKTYTVKITAWDRDATKAEKTLQIKIYNGIIINLPSVDKVVGDEFDPKENVTIFDGQGKPVDLDTVIIDDSKVDMSKPGNYDVTYTYTDSLGNTETKTNTIRVHGKLQFEGLDRIDLIEKEGIYVVDTAKAFYMNNEGKKVYVDGVYDTAILDQSVVGKNELTYSAVHPINYVKETSTKQNVFIHGDIMFHKPVAIPTGKVNTTLDPKMDVSATFDFVNDDGTITTKDVPVTSKDVTSDKVGYVDGKISAKVEVVSGLINSKKDTVKVAFNGLPYIDAANTIRYDGVIPSKTDIINKMLATAGMKLANGTVTDITDKIDYSDVNRVVLDKNGDYEITLTVKDQDGFTTYTTVNVIVEIKVPEEPVIPVPPTPIPPVNPITPNVPTNPQNPVAPVTPPTPEVPVEKDTAAAVSKDIPLSEAIKNDITEEFIKSYITASTENKGLVNFEIVSHTVQSKVGEYEATIRLEDGTVLTVKLRVVDDSTKDVEQPEYGRDEDCIIHWIILLLFAGYSIYAIVAMLKRRKDNKDLEKALEEPEENELNAEGVEQDEN